MTSLLSAYEVSKSYLRESARIDALKNVSLQVAAGEVVGLLGPNGSGKSTFMRLMAKLTAPDAGMIEWQGRPLSVKDLANIGLLLEGRGSVNDRLSSDENARYFCALRERAFDAQWFARLCGLLEIPDVHCPVRQFSSGFKIRSSLLTTLVHRPSLVLLDEPTLGLDAPGVRQLECLIAECAGEGTSFLVSSHDLYFIERICQRIVCLSAGCAVFDGSRQAFASMEIKYRVTLRPGPWADAIAQLDFPWQSATGGLIEACLADRQQLSSLIKGLSPYLDQLESIEIKEIDLREKYLRMLASAADSRALQHHA